MAGVERHGHRGAARPPTVGDERSCRIGPGLGSAGRQESMGAADGNAAGVARQGVTEMVAGHDGVRTMQIPVDDPLADLSPTAIRVLTAAQRILAERGLSALTLNAVADESGENKAMTKYYFGNKAGLIAALVDAAVHDECLESASRMQGITDQDRTRRLVDELQHMSEASPSFLAFYDLLPHALRNDELRPRLATLYEWYLQLKLDWLGLDPDVDVELRAELRPLAQLLSAVIDGLALQVLIDPQRFDIDAAYAMLERILTMVLPELLEGAAEAQSAS